MTVHCIINTNAKDSLYHHKDNNFPSSMRYNYVCHAILCQSFMIIPCFLLHCFIFNHSKPAVHLALLFNHLRYIHFHLPLQNSFSFINELLFLYLFNFLNSSDKWKKKKKNETSPNLLKSCIYSPS